MSSANDDLIAAVRAGNHELVRLILKTRPECVNTRDPDGATALHYAAESGNRGMVIALLDAGAEVNALDLQYGATPAGWAIEYLRQRGGLLGMEIEDVGYAIANGDERLVRRYLERLPALRDAADRTGTPLKSRAVKSSNREIARLFGAPD